MLRSALKTSFTAPFTARALASALLLTLSTTCVAATVEEQRLEKARADMPALFGSLQSALDQFSASWPQFARIADAETRVAALGRQLFTLQRASVQSGAQADDRPLYWARLFVTRTLRDAATGFAADAATRETLVQVFERHSRGISDIDWQPRAPQRRRVFITGFDPFLLDRHINQSNPSGLAALMLDGKLLRAGDQEIEIEAVLIPVRYADFDQGLIENLLTPLYSETLYRERLYRETLGGAAQTDLVATISMGRREFDLERFPGRRRSAAAPDNLNVYSGGSLSAPVVPLLNGALLDGPEFVEFSLPAAAMQSAQGPYKINDNCQVQTLEKSFCALSLADLHDAIAVQGGGGGYLSNEISYRAIRLRDQLGVTLPVGHIHTPAIRQFEPETELQIVGQIEQMLRAAASTITTTIPTTTTTTTNTTTTKTSPAGK